MRSVVVNSFSLLLVSLWLNSAAAVVVNIKTVAEEFDADTSFVNIGDSIKFIIGIGHDVKEITEAAYDANTTTPYAGGFYYSAGNSYYVIDEVRTYHFCCTYHMSSSQMKGVIIASGFESSYEYSNMSTLSVFPNPTFDYIYFDNNENFTFRVIDLNGNIVLVSETTGGFADKIDVTLLKPGWYFAEFILGGKKKTIRFIKQ